MAVEDKIRWNDKYTQKTNIPDEALEIVKTYSKLAKGKDALDLACGMGRHAKYLAKNGFNVDALDISSVAISQLKEQNIDNISPKEVDFDQYTLEKNKYDLIVAVYFLKRELFPQMIDALKKDGILIIETFMHAEDNERVPSNPAFLLHEGELEEAFGKKCELLLLKEFEDRDYKGYKTKKTQMVAKKI